jgi:hypothetical protein
VIIKSDLKIDISDPFRRAAVARVKGAALYATDKAIRVAHRQTKAQVIEVGLGRLRGLVAVTSDLEKGTFKQLPGDGFKVSGIMYQKKRSERLDGIFESYGRGAVITPKKGGYLWFPTDEIKRLGGPRGGRFRLQPSNWKAAGLEQRIGKLFFIPGAHRGERLAIVKNVGVNAAGRSRSARSLKRNGQPRKGDVQRESIVAFIGIKQTVRYQRFDAEQNRSEASRFTEQYFNQGLRRGGRA